MRITTTFTYTWRTGAATLLAAYPKWSRLAMVGMPVILPLLAIGVDSVVLRIWLALSGVVLVFTHGRQVHALIKQGAIDVELDEDGFTRERPDVGASSMRWSATLDVRRQYGLLVIRTIPRCVASVPESAFSTEQLGHLDEFIRLRRYPTARIDGTEPTANTPA
ncbi:hypothetical protein [Embleya sp. NBC_00896]|uniref:hypothetical protein n=1 Tax=Embleya sp. NBC_00896 TaxID=2975961 RepID=UPI002F912AA2|nr:hypothetical protein OG928_45415 [Embleya sp. NBC_00896]